MKVRILSGSQIGQVIEQGLTEAESNIAMGFAEVVRDEPVAEPVVPPAPPVPAEVVRDEPAVKKPGR